MKTYLIDITEIDGETESLLMRLESSDLNLIVINLQLAAQSINPKGYKEFTDNLRSEGQEKAAVIGFLKGVFAAVMEDEKPDAFGNTKRDYAPDGGNPPMATPKDEKTPSKSERPATDEEVKS
jgi:hypothetical protein